MYLESARSATQTDSPSSRRAPYMDDVDYLRSTPDGMVTVSRENHRVHGAGLRLVFRNGATTNISLGVLRWYLKHDLKSVEGDPIPALVSILARQIFRFLGGKKWHGMSFEEWMDCDNYLHTARAR